MACAAWIRRRDEKAPAARVFAAYGRAGAAAAGGSSPPAVEVLGFDSKECYLSPEPLVRTPGPFRFQLLVLSVRFGPELVCVFFTL